MRCHGPASPTWWPRRSTHGPTTRSTRSRRSWRPTPRPGSEPVRCSGDGWAAGAPGSVGGAMTLTQKEAPAAPPTPEPEPVVESGNFSRVLQFDRRPGGDHRRLHPARLGRHPALHRDPHRHRDAPRAGSLRHGQAGGHEGDRIFRRLRPAALVRPPRRDRVRRQGHSRRRLRAHHRLHLDRGGGRGGRAPGLPGPALPPAHHRRLGGIGDAPAHRLRPRPDPGPQLRRGLEQLQGELARALVGRESDAGPAGRASKPGTPSSPSTARPSPTRTPCRTSSATRWASR